MNSTARRLLPPAKQDRILIWRSEVLQSYPLPGSDSFSTTASSSTSPSSLSSAISASSASTAPAFPFEASSSGNNNTRKRRQDSRHIADVNINNPWLPDTPQSSSRARRFWARISRPFSISSPISGTRRFEMDADDEQGSPFPRTEMYKELIPTMSPRASQHVPGGQVDGPGELLENNDFVDEDHADDDDGVGHGASSELRDKQERLRRAARLLEKSS